ncbi:uncharacterized protein LOC131233496 [Magnolia sinica]|uniref:uncharacterized protein LOC131233496 n=1 Tax=Magnolia sinica TaxID=86752 RepID=UPI002659C2F5|nr:uncharacterized protein LOC131233496 [Magnolia sinica]
MEFLDEVEEEYGKCRKHPSQSRIGVCPICLKNRLILLCPHCANVRPCVCYHSPDFPSTSTSSSSSLSSTDAVIGAVGRMSFLIDSEPAFRRTRSAAFPFLRQKSGGKIDGFRRHPPETRSWSSSFASLLSFLRVEKKKKKADEEKTTTVKQLRRSRSVGFSCYSDSDEISGRDARLRGWGWLPSPIKVFRQPKTSKVLQERSPLCRG